MQSADTTRPRRLFCLPTWHHHNDPTDSSRSYRIILLFLFALSQNPRRRRERPVVPPLPTLEPVRYAGQRKESPPAPVIIEEVPQPTKQTQPPLPTLEPLENILQQTVPQPVPVIEEEEVPQQREAPTPPPKPATVRPQVPAGFPPLYGQAKATFSTKYKIGDRVRLSCNQRLSVSIPVFCEQIRHLLFRLRCDPATPGIFYPSSPLFLWHSILTQP